MSVKHLPARQTQRVKYSDNVVGKEKLISGQSLENAFTDIATLKEDVTTLKAGTFSSGLSVTGSVEATGSIKAGDDLEVTGDATVGGDIEATGHLKSAYSVITPKLTTTGDSISAEKPVIEMMTGYAASASYSEGYTITKDYVGACKNGNKITFAFSGHITRTPEYVGNNPHITTLTIPADVGAKLVPSNIGSTTNYLCSMKIQVARDIAYYTDITIGIQKNNNTSLAVAFFGGQNLAENVEYYFRFDITFLLSPNLAS